MSIDSSPVVAEPAVSDSTIRAPYRWAWWGVAAGVLGVVATLVTNVTAGHEPPRSSDLAKLSGTTYHVGGVAGYLAVAALLVLAGAWRCRLVAQHPRSIAARVVADGLTASAAALTLGYGWKLALADYLPHGTDHGMFDSSGLWVYFVLNDFGAFLGWLGVVVAAGAMIALGLRTDVVPAWIGWVSVIPVLAVAGMSLVGEIAGFAGVVGPFWMVVAFGGLALRRTTAPAAAHPVPGDA